MRTLSFCCRISPLRGALRFSFNKLRINTQCKLASENRQKGGFLVEWIRNRKGFMIKLIPYALKSFLFGIKFPIGISVDVTNKCNLRCKHYYFFQQNYQKELSEDELLERIIEIKKKYPSIIHSSWVGGEPLLRKNVVEKGLKFFPFNMVVTNGTIELPKWKNCVFNVSVDGTKEYYEKVRAPKMYDKVKRYANRNDIRVNIACVLNKKNYYCIEDLLKEWRKTKVGGVNFDFFTPIKGAGKDL